MEDSDRWHTPILTASHFGGIVKGCNVTERLLTRLWKMEQFIPRVSMFPMGSKSTISCLLSCQMILEVPSHTVALA